MFKKRRMRVMQRSDGKFFATDNYGDHPRWVSHPADADKCYCLYSQDDKDTLTEDAQIVEIEVEYKLSGRIEKDLYSNGEWVD